MILDEAIKQEKEIAKQYEHLVDRYQNHKDYGNPKSSITDCAKSCKICGEEHQQLAEWLKDYKRLLEQQPCDDAISRQAAQTELKNCEVVDVRDENDNLVGYYNADTVDSIVRNLPPVTPQQKSGKWIKGKDEYGTNHFTCPFCGHDIATKAENWDDNYCANCGADLRGAE